MSSTNFQDLRYRYFDLDGGGKIVGMPTPNLDQIAADGMNHSGAAGWRHEFKLSFDQSIAN